MTTKILKLNSSNWPAVYEALKRSNLNPTTLNLSEIKLINENDLIIIPGVGNIHSLSSEIEKNFGILSFKELIIKKKVKVIGICLGFQFLCSTSEEDPSAECLNLFNYSVESIFNPSRPSVGWHKIYTDKNIFKDQDMLSQIHNNFFYFTHSFGVKGLNNFSQDEYVFKYNVQEDKSIVGAIINKNFIGFQFHPEKSGEEGIKLLCKSIKFLTKKNNEQEQR